ncbi:glutathione S-transferase family protein [Azospirillum sp. RWY-5-1]|uniref:Glutathione S-transferase family protein n=1 Tax=Azospirillum oleiclasticum TaxID=2735135 RepID=A0ABX2TJQ5_9PROT|nr:glutathione S-transferase family protein [Azospirillum oleiclasticum]NYZ16973.1 glutathione S-transferase family protein [Azospirillum oleiclasticum]NYZ24584.1 glutathione S-transferase family protein [Azospirillum oleiclasticum]
MLRLYDNLSSGNAYKVRLLLHKLAIPVERIEMDIDRGETRTPDFLAKNPNGRVPALALEDGTILPESNAILWYLAEGTRFLPADRLERAQVLQWMFFEQYSHEPNVATLRYWITHKVEMTAERRMAEPGKRRQGYDALGVMEGHLKDRAFFVGDRLTIADIALYAYTHVADEGGFDLAAYPALRAWLDRVAADTPHIPITQG